MDKKAATRSLCGGIISLLGFGLVVPGFSQAAEGYGPSATEALLLPEYCREGLSEERRKAWGRTLSPGCDGLHHYCYALNWINRAKAQHRNLQYRKHALVNARGDLEYTTKRSTAKCPLTPDFFIVQGEIALLEDQLVEAENSFLKAAQAKPDYPKSWLALSDLYRQTGRLDKAREALEKGLQASPDKYKDYLRKRLAELSAEAEKAQQSPAPAKAEGK